MGLATLKAAMPIVASIAGDQAGVVVHYGVRISTAATNGREIYISPLPDNDASAIIILRGYIYHEAFHIHESDMSMFSVEKESKALRWHLAMICEDVRIELENRQDKPGAIHAINELCGELVKNGVFAHVPASKHPMNVFSAHCLYTARAFIRGTKVMVPLAEQQAATLEEVLPGISGRVNALLTQIPQCTQSRDCFKLADELIKLVKDYKDENENDQEGGDSQSQGGDDQSNGDQSQGGGDQSNGDQSQGGDDQSNGNQSQGDGDQSDGDQSQGGGDQSDGDQSQGGGDQSDGDQSQGGGDQSNGNQSQGDGDQSDGDQSQGGGDQSNGNQSQGGGDQSNGNQSQGGGDQSNGKQAQTKTGKPSQMDRKQAAANAQKIIDDADKADQCENRDIGDAAQGQIQEKTDAMSESEKRCQSSTGDMVRGDLSGSQIDFAVADKASVGLQTRLRVLVQAKYAKQMRSSMNGRVVSRNRLAGIATGRTDLFLRERTRPAINTAASILLDRSGSMSGNEIEVAMGAGYSMARALEAIPHVQREVLAFGGHLNVWQIAGFGEPTARAKHRFVSSTSGTTPMAEGIWTSAKSLAQRRESKKIMIVCTDGTPNSCRVAGDPYANTRYAIQYLTNAGIEMIGIGIGTDSVEDLFPTSRVIGDVSELAYSLSEILLLRL